MGKGQGREEITGEGKVAPASLRLRSGQALPLSNHDSRELEHVGTAALGCPVERSSTGFYW